MSFRRISTVLFALGLICLPVVQVRAGAHFLRGDANHDMSTDISDPVFILGFLFLGEEAPPCPDAADVDDNGQIQITDAINMLGWLFQGGDAPAAPYPTFEGDPTPDDALDPCLGEAVVLSGAIESQTLTSDKWYKLVGEVDVEDGKVLNIDAGVTVVGDTATDGLLVIKRGGKLNAIGTATHPVVFTSDQEVGNRNRGDWGGLILLGNGDNNEAGKTGEAEGLQGGVTWGGGDSVIADESSGQLSYVRVEFGGTEISPNNEVNAISLFGCGSGTHLDHIQCKYNDDDGVEWFGGAATLKYGLCFGIADDNFDYSFGWNGKGQYWLAKQSEDDADRGFEVDNHEGAFSNTPLTNPLIANVTLIGISQAESDAGGESDTGMVLRRGCGGRVYNGIIMGFRDAGLDIDEAVTTNNNPTDGTLAVDYFVFYDNKEDAETGETEVEEETAANGYKYTSAEFITTLNPNNIFATGSPIVDPYNMDAPDYRPQGDALTAGMDLTTMDAFFDATSYLGAVAPDGADWTQARWISYYRN